MARDTYTVKELADRAGVSTRTVYYYVSEGLLPPPEGGGPATTYSDDHLARLRLIRRLKDEYLPLAEIRRRVAGLSPDEVAGLLAQPAPLPPAEDARAYLARVLGTEGPAPASSERRLAARSPLAMAGGVAASGAEPSAPPVEEWRRIRIDSDLELHVRRHAGPRVRRNLTGIVEAIRRILAS
jgi:DNA-binding transcriptional MerR regulator